MSNANRPIKNDCARAEPAARDDALAPFAWG